MSLQKLKDANILGIQLSEDKKIVHVYDQCCYKFRIALTLDDIDNIIQDLDELAEEMYQANQRGLSPENFTDPD